MTKRYAVPLLAAGTFILGVVGFAVGPPDEPLLNAAYRSVQLFLLDFDNTESWWLLDLARFAAAGITGSAVLSLYAVLALDVGSDLRRRRATDHTVLVGAGYVSTQLLPSLSSSMPTTRRWIDAPRRRRPTPVAIIDVDQSRLQRFVDSHPRSAVVAIAGDASTVRVMRLARVRRAARVLVAVGEPTEAVRVADAVARHVRPGSGTDVLLHVNDLMLLHELRVRFAFDHEGPTDVFNLYENAARKLLWEFDDAVRVRGHAHSVLIIGDGPLVEALALAAVRELVMSVAGCARVIIASPELRDRMVSRWPEYSHQYDRVTWIKKSPPEFAFGYGEVDAADTVVVTFQESETALAIGAMLAARGADQCRVVVDHLDAGSHVRGVDVVNVSDLAVDQGRLLEDTTITLLARAYHEAYLAVDFEEKASDAIVPFELLEPEFIESSRAAARTFVTWLRDAGHEIRRPEHADVMMAPQILSAAVGRQGVAALAEREHARWCQEPRNKEKPSNRSWASLPDGVREANTRLADRWGHALAHVGYVVFPAPACDVKLHPDDILHGAATFERRGTVTARRLDRSETWSTDAGDELTGAVNDWALANEGREWTITDGAFRSTYEHVEGDVYRRTGTVRAGLVRATTSVETTEGTATATRGSWLVEDEAGNRWPVPADHFRSAYQPLTRLCR